MGQRWIIWLQISCTEQGGCYTPRSLQDFSHCIRWAIFDLFSLRETTHSLMSFSLRKYLLSPWNTIYVPSMARGSVVSFPSPCSHSQKISIEWRWGIFWAAQMVSPCPPMQKAMVWFVQRYLQLDRAFQQTQLAVLTGGKTGDSSPYFSLTFFASRLQGAAGDTMCHWRNRWTLFRPVAVTRTAVHRQLVGKTSYLLKKILPSWREWLSTYCYSFGQGD